mmetsp:Transcript_58111/g.151452  ORF Transcript_58111/g.151452 Transcript_58111/m.151452 type:complete len:213 (-) Transcript_58111:1266-1904(-)
MMLVLRFLGWMPGGRSPPPIRPPAKPSLPPPLLSNIPGIPMPVGAPNSLPPPLPQRRFSCNCQSCTAQLATICCNCRVCVSSRMMLLTMSRLERCVIVSMYSSRGTTPSICIALKTPIASCGLTLHAAIIALTLSSSFKKFVKASKVISSVVVRSMVPSKSLSSSWTTSELIMAHSISAMRFCASLTLRVLSTIVAVRADMASQEALSMKNM